MRAPTADLMQNPYITDLSLFSLPLVFTSPLGATGRLNIKFLHVRVSVNSSW